jgi:preprotein translocase subunit SecA
MLKRLFAEGKEKEAGIPLLRAYRGLPKNTALIKFLSENGVKSFIAKNRKSITCKTKTRKCIK